MRVYFHLNYETIYFNISITLLYEYQIIYFMIATNLINCQQNITFIIITQMFLEGKKIYSHVTNKLITLCCYLLILTYK